MADYQRHCFVTVSKRLQNDFNDFDFENHFQNDVDLKSFAKLRRWFWFQIFLEMILPNTDS